MKTLSKRSRRKWSAAVLTFVLAAAVYVVMGNTRSYNTEPFLAEADLGDGVHRVRLVKAAEGPLSYDWRDPRSELLQAITPKVLRKPVHFKPVELDGKAPLSIARPHETEAVSLLFRAVDASGEYVTFPPLKHPQLEFVESTGFVFGAFPTQIESWFPSVVGVERTAVPRRDETLHLRIADRKGTQPPIDLQVANPFRRKEIVEWKPEPLPVRRMIGNAAVTLTGFKVHAPHRVTAELNLEPGDWMAWLSDHWFEDATGNRGHWLSPFEPAWKVTLRATPTRFSALAPKAIWRLPPIELPAPGEERALGLSRWLDGHKIVIDKIALVPPTPLNSLPDTEIGLRARYAAALRGFRRQNIPLDPNEPPPPPLARNLPDGRIELHVRLAQNESVFPVLARIVHPDGRFSREGSLTATGAPERRVRIGFAQPDYADEVTIEVGVCEPQQVEFIVAPPPELRQKMANWSEEEINRSNNVDPSPKPLPSLQQMMQRNSGE